MDIYAENILDHYRHPRNKIPLPEPVPSRVEGGEGRGLPVRSSEGAKAGEGEKMITHTEANLSCGDEVSVQLRIEGDIIKEVGWDGTGCAISQAAMSLLSEELVGKSLEEIDAMKMKDMNELLGVPVGPRRFKCALLGLHAVKNAALTFRKKPVQGWNETAGE